MKDVFGKEIVSYDEAVYLRMAGFDGECSGYYHMDACYEGCEDERYECASSWYRNSYSYSRAAAPTIRADKLWYTKNKVKPFESI